MAEQDQLQSGMAGAQIDQPLLHIVDDALPAILLGEESQLDCAAGRAAMATMIMRFDFDAVRRQKRSRCVVAGGMFGHAVGDQHHGSWRSAGLPAIGGEIDAVAGAETSGGEAHDGVVSRR